jgi:squalene monooxygenase
MYSPSSHLRTVTLISDSQFTHCNFQPYHTLARVLHLCFLNIIQCSETNQNEIIVVGAGVAGSAAAITLARQGYQVLLLERNLQEPDCIFGELMQPGGVIALEELGLGSCLQGIGATPVRGYHMYWGDEQVTFLYPPSASTDVPRAVGWSFRHGKFITKSREAAQREPGIKMVEGTVTGLVKDGENGPIVGVEFLSGGKLSARYVKKTRMIPFRS